MCALSFVSVATLVGPDMAFGYEGRDSSAAWRADAQERIIRHRTTPLAVRVSDSNGSPIPNVHVSVQMREHQFEFGTAVKAGIFRQAEVFGFEDQLRYREEVSNIFNSVVFENDMKPRENFGWMSPTRRDEVLNYALPYLQSQSIKVRGHYLTGSPLVLDGRVPQSWMDAYNSNDFAHLETLITDYVTDIASDLNGVVTDWDAVNHILSIDEFDDAALGRVVGAAHNASPGTPMYVNENKILARPGFGSPDTKRNAYKNQIQSLLDAGVALGGVGMQSHFLSDGSQLTPISEVVSTLNDFATLGLPIRVTEHDVDTTDELLQRDYSRDFLTAVFSHPSVKGVHYWGFEDNTFWDGEAQFFDEDWNLKPAGEAILDLMYNQWWTEEHGRTGEQGAFTVLEAFLGDYEAVVTFNGEQYTQQFSLDDASDPLLLDFVVPASILLGDLDGDGDVDGVDIDPFVQILSGNLPYDPAGDFDGDGDVDGVDIDPFVGALSGSGMATSALTSLAVVPEPTTLVLFGLGGLAALGRRRRGPADRTSSPSGRSW